MSIDVLFVAGFFLSIINEIEHASYGSDAEGVNTVAAFVETGAKDRLIADIYIKEEKVLCSTWLVQSVIFVPTQMASLQPNIQGNWVTLPFTEDRIFVPIDNWIGFDFDGTLARTDNPGHFQPPYPLGEPYPAMLEAARCLIAQGVKIKIFTARACEAAAIPVVQTWAEKHGLGLLEVTNLKDYHLIRFYDDRAVPFPLSEHQKYNPLQRYEG